MLDIDGRIGKGCGQILRTSLALSAVTGKATRLHHIREGRAKNGLLHQHLTAVRVAAKVCGAKRTGDMLRSSEVTFDPRKIQAGSYTFNIGSPGSVNLVVQTILPLLMLAKEPSTIPLYGGTHNPASPSSDFFGKIFAPALRSFDLSYM